MDLVAVCSYFNPYGSKKRLKNYIEFRSGMKNAGVTVVTVQVLFNGEDSQLDDYEYVFSFDVTDVLWYKEQLINKGIIYAIKEFNPEAIMWVDADTVFNDKDWNKKIVDALDRFRVVQCFRHAQQLYSDGDLKRLCSTETIRHGLPMGKGVPGGAWAARKDFFEKNSLYEYAIAGGGDSLFCLGVNFNITKDLDKFRDLLNKNGKSINKWSLSFRIHIMHWASKLDINPATVGFVKQDAIFLEHGSKKNRWGKCRAEILKDYSPPLDVRRNSKGLLSWVNVEMSHRVEEYFRLRSDDEEVQI